MIEELTEEFLEAAFTGLPHCVCVLSEMTVNGKVIKPGWYQIEGDRYVAYEPERS